MARPLDRTEARDAARQLFSNRATPMQVGAFLLLLRFRGETAAEIAGLIEGAQETFKDNIPKCRPDIDWSSYADRHKQQPWFVLAALLLAMNGLKVLMHGVEGALEGYAPTRPFLKALGIPISNTLQQAAKSINQTGFAYIGTESFCPVVESLCDIRQSLGVRTVINTLARGLNPLGAPHQLIGVAHPPYMPVHADVAKILGQPYCTIIKGGGGEAQRNPLKPCRVTTVNGSIIGEEVWPALNPEKGINWRNEILKPELAKSLWLGDYLDKRAESAIIATTAVALKQTQKACSTSDADQMAASMWNSRSSLENFSVP